MQPSSTDRPRRRTSARQRARLIERFRGSGLTRAAFAQRHGVGLSTLGKWLTEARASWRQPTQVAFREMKLAEVASAPAWAMEVEGADGVTVRCREALSVQDLAALLRGPTC